MPKLLGAMIVAGCAALAAPAFAHAILKSTVPQQSTTVAAPKQLSMTFTNKVTLADVKLVAGNRDVPLKREKAGVASETHIIPVPPLKAGTYEVRWTAFASDGHPMSRKWAFTVAVR